MGCAASSDSQDRQCFTPFTLCVREPWKNFRSHPVCAQYKPLRKVGSGAFSEVWKARELATGASVALKVVFWDNPALRSHHRRILRKEVDVLRALRHEHIIGYHRHLEDTHHLVLVLELLRGGGLPDHLYEVERCGEAEAARLFAQLLAAVEHMHGKGIMHRDIKPENVVLAARAGPPCLKLVDFGLAREYSGARSVKARLGSPGFMAPEVILGERHTPAMDMFSLGVILFVLLTGHKPMRPEQARALAYTTLQAHEYPRMAGGAWRRLSDGARDLVLRLLDREPLRRISAKQAARHEWIVGCAGAAAAAAAEGERKRARRASRERRFRGFVRALSVRAPPAAALPGAGEMPSATRELCREESRERESAMATRSRSVSARPSAPRSAYSTEAPLEGTGRNEDGHAMHAVAEEDAAHLAQCENVLTFEGSQRKGGWHLAEGGRAGPPSPVTAPLAALSGRPRSTVAVA